MANRDGVEDGSGWGGLVPTAAERREESEVKRLGDRIVALTKERDEWRGLYEHGLGDRNELLARVQALETALRDREAAMRQFGGHIKWLGGFVNNEVESFEPETTVEPHTCPYKVEINDDSETLCTCGPEKTQDCRDDI